MKAGKVLHIILIVLITLFLTGHSMLNNSKIQHKAALHVVGIAQNALGTDVSLERVQLVYPFGVSIDDFTIYDLNKDTLAHIGSVTLHFKPLQLLWNKISFSNIRLNNPIIKLKADSIGAEPNYAFLTTLFGGKEGNKPMTFRANSVLVRNGSIRYDILNAEQTTGLFNPNHIRVSSLMANLSLKSIGSDSVAFIVRKFSFAEHSGLHLSSAKGAVTVGKGFSHVRNLKLSTPHSNFVIDDLMAHTGLTDHPDGIPDFSAVLQASLTGSDFKALIPQAADMTDCIDIGLNCSSSNRIIRLKSLTVHDQASIVDLKGSGTVYTGTDPLYKGCRNTQLSGNFGMQFPEWIDSQFGAFGIKIPTQLYNNLGDGSFKLVLDNESDKIDSHLTLISQAGNINAELSGAAQKYNMNITGSDILLSTITGNDDLGYCTLSAVADITRTDDSYICNYNGKIGTIQYKGYNYHNVALYGTASPGAIVSSVRFADRNGELNLDADINTTGYPLYQLSMTAHNLNLSAYNMTEQDSVKLSTTLHMQMRGSDVDHINGKISVDDLDYSDTEGSWQMNNLTVSVGDMNEHYKMISVFGDFLNVSLVGDYKISSLPYTLSRACGDVLPTVGNMIAHKLKVGTDSHQNNIIVDAQLNNSDILQHVFHLPLDLKEPATLKMSLNDQDSTYRCRINIPSMDIAGETLSGLLVTLDSEEGACVTEIGGSYGSTGNDGELIDISVSFLAFQDIIRGVYSWQNEKGDIYGNAKTLSQFFSYNDQEKLQSVTYLDSTDIIVKGIPWHIDISDFRTDLGRFSISGFKISSIDQYLFIDGIISADSTDVLRLSLHNIDLDNTLSILHINPIQLKGIASGDMSMAGITGRPSFSGSFTIDDFSFLNSYHGQLNARCYWEPRSERVVISGNMSDNGVSNTLLSGYYIPKDKFIDINLGANHTDLYFLNKWTSSVFKELSGRAVGNLRLFGKLPDLDLEGEAVLENGRFVQSAANATFIIERDTLWFEPGRMLFTNVDFSDENNHSGILNCIISHDHFSDWRVDMNAYVDNMLVYNQPNTEKSSFNATVYAQGKMQLIYNKPNGLDIKVDAKTGPGTRLGFNPNSGTVADYNFLTIVDRDNLKDNEEINEIKPEKSNNGNSNFNLDLNVECSEDALIDLSISSLTGFLKGTGNIAVKYNTKDGPILNGIYNLSYGQCSLSLEDLIRKNFTLMEGSYVRFNGAPIETEFNIKTYHNVNSVSIYDLDPSVSSNSNVRVRCLMDITGNASDPQLSFDIDMPSGTSEEKAVLASSTATEEQRNIQFMYLLAIGRFYTYDVNSKMNNGLTPSTMESIVNSTVSGQINNLLSQVLDNDKVTISSNLSASSYLSNDATNLNNKELEGILEAHLLNNRLLVNGNFGYKENTINNTSNFIGDFEVKYLLLPRQGISIKGYNKSNDKYFSKATLTTQGVGLVFEKDF